MILLRELEDLGMLPRWKKFLPLVRFGNGMSLLDNEVYKQGDVYMFRSGTDGVFMSQKGDKLTVDLITFCNGYVKFNGIYFESDKVITESLLIDLLLLNCIDDIKHIL